MDIEISRLTGKTLAELNQGELQACLAQVDRYMEPLREKIAADTFRLLVPFGKIAARNQLETVRLWPEYEGPFWPVAQGQGQED